LSLVAKFPDRAPVVLSGIAEIEPDPKPTGRKAHSRIAGGTRSGHPLGFPPAACE
jgi:hypothetical protein